MMSKVSSSTLQNIDKRENRKQGGIKSQIQIEDFLTMTTLRGITNLKLVFFTAINLVTFSSSVERN